MGPRNNMEVSIKGRINAVIRPLNLNPNWWSKL